MGDAITKVIDAVDWEDSSGKWDKKIKAARAEHAALVARIKVLESAINWATGIDGEFPPRQEGQGAYYWRAELTRRAGMVYDGARYVAAALSEPRK